MSQPTQMEKLEEIVRALEKLNDGGNWFHTTDEAGGPYTAWRGDGEPDEIASRALTLAREFLDNAVERWMDREDVEDAEGPYWWIFDNPETTERATHDPDPLRVLLITDPTP